jgi:hypothetical protein
MGAEVKRMGRETTAPCEREQGRPGPYRIKPETVAAEGPDTPQQPIQNQKNGHMNDKASAVFIKFFETVAQRIRILRHMLISFKL